MFNTDIQNVSNNLTEACNMMLELARKDNGLVFVSDIREELYTVTRLLVEAEAYLHRNFEVRA